ncbi:hypothetical protein [Sabulibacter ruber]|uniref:hypothetical protein n=1 Tax=Sabulibacter ruber TaxID=2811901 RepID=UPI001A977504|nr:hypothetical protein [Sabulibacter ruber]
MIGLVDDYQGRKWIKDDPNESTFIDKFHATENILYTYLDLLIKEENRRSYDKVQTTFVKWEKPNCFYCHEFKRLLSTRLSEKVNEAYEFKWNKETDPKGNKVYVGTLKPKVFKEDVEKYSFIAGAYVRYGSREEELYTIKFTNSLSKFDAVLRELKAIRCEIEKVDVSDGASVVQQISFKPSKELKVYLDKQEKLRLDILAKKDKFSKEKETENKSYDLFTTSQDK